MITHDLKNPISSIIGYVSLSNFKKDMTIEDYKEYFNVIGSSAEYMLKVIENLLELSKLENNKLSFVFDDLTIHFVKDKILSNYNNKLISKNIELLFSGNLETIIRTDIAYFMRIIDNLISNAIKFTYPHKKIFFNVSKKGNTTIISIKDEGQGMTEKDLSKIFGKFARLSARPTGDESTSGLGLSIVKDICDKLGIEVAVSSEGKDQGTEFTLTISDIFTDNK
ncbi:MAG: HAMP domain-containing histidine kinase [Candidatus Delongbacteria bacterium]|nr:HAMP domain-containing histidine kinase [Candidatus Delongbacteria bacterium]MBN2833357.1 HAMP domain-containing histidine kinase [Candidatus Delongbacteria bacterium]